jgi:hypothetical protein
VYLPDTGITGTLSATLADATLAATGTLPIAGTLAATMANATLSATGALPITGTLAATLASATLTAEGALSIAGMLSATLADATLAATGEGPAPDPITGELAVTLADATLAATGRVGDDARALGGDDAPARREDIDRLARRRKRQEAERAERAAQLRATLERAYRAATGEAEGDAETALADAVEIAPVEMRERIADVAPMLGTAQALAELRAILVAMQDRRDRLAREDDELAFILAVL